MNFNPLKNNIIKLQNTGSLVCFIQDGIMIVEPELQLRQNSQVKQGL